MTTSGEYKQISEDYLALLRMSAEATGYMLHGLATLFEEEAELGTERTIPTPGGANVELNQVNIFNGNLGNEAETSPSQPLSPPPSGQPLPGPFPREAEFGLGGSDGEGESTVDELIDEFSARFVPTEDKTVALVAATLLDERGVIEENPDTGNRERVYRADGFTLRQSGEVYSIEDSQGQDAQMQFYLSASGPVVWGDNRLSQLHKEEFKSVYRHRKTRREPLDLEEGDLSKTVATLGALAPRGSKKVLDDLKGMKAFGFVNHTINQLGVESSESRVEVKVGGYRLKRERGEESTTVSIESNDDRGELLSYTARRTEDGISVELDAIRLDRDDLLRLREIAENSQYLAATSIRDAQPEDASIRDAQPEDASIRDAQPEDASIRDAQPEDASVRDAQPEDASVRDTQTEDASIRDTQTEGVSISDTQTQDVSIRDTRSQRNPIQSAETIAPITQPSEASEAILMTAWPIEVHPVIAKALEYFEPAELPHVEGEPSEATIFVSDAPARQWRGQMEAQDGQLTEPQQIQAYELCQNHREFLETKGVVLPTPEALNTYLTQKKTERVRFAANPEAQISVDLTPAPEASQSEPPGDREVEL